MSKNRITSAYIEGLHTKRPPGYSEILHQDIIPKFAPECDIHGETDQFRLDISRFLNHLKASDLKIDESYLLMLKLFKEKIFSYASLGFMKGNTSKHIFSEKILEVLETHILSIKDKITQKSSDFVLFDNSLCMELDQLRLTTRKLERVYWHWAYSNAVVSQLYTHVVEDPDSISKKMSDIVLMGNILNRFSSFLYWLTRHLFELQYPNEQLKQWNDPISDSSTCI